VSNEKSKDDFIKKLQPAITGYRFLVMKTRISPSIIMRTKKFGESDLFVSFFTQDRGRLKGIAKGARRSKKRFVNCFDVFSLVNLEYGSGREGDLHFLQSGKLIQGYPGLRRDLDGLSRASYMIELTEILFPWGVVDQEMFDVLRDSLGMLCKAARKDIVLLLFELRAMTLGGFGINLRKCCVCGRAYKVEGRAVFKCEQGGIACLKCEHESAVYPGVDPATAKILLTVQNKPWPFVKNLVIDDRAAGEITNILRLHRDHCLERRLTTSKYI
jgi:DNA repair protein RecO (recombination protein O)